MLSYKNCFHIEILFKLLFALGQGTLMSVLLCSMFSVSLKPKGSGTVYILCILTVIHRGLSVNLLLFHIILFDCESLCLVENEPSFY